MANYQESQAAGSLAAGAYNNAAAGPLLPAVSGVSWGAIFAGAAGAAALSFVLVLLGTGLGMSSVSPWSSEGIGAATFGWATVAWITFVSLVAAGVGGYLAGRLRTKWSGLHTAEVYFRDTAHGFLAWAVATLVAAAIVSSAVGSAVSAGAQAGASALGGAATAAMSVSTAGAAGAANSESGDSSANGPMGYFIDSLFRSPANGGASAAMTPNANSSVNANGPLPVREVSRIFANSVRTGTLAQDDAQYVAQLIAARTGISQQEAQKRVTDTFNKVQTGIQEAKDQAKVAADKARKATAYGSLWLVFSLLIGAFVASVCATLGGRRRDLQSTL